MEVFKLNGQPTAFSKRGPESVAALLETLKQGELLTSKELARKMGIGYDHFKSYSYGKEPALSEHRHNVVVAGQRMLVWGSPKTIAQLRGELE